MMHYDNLLCLNIKFWAHTSVCFHCMPRKISLHVHATMHTSDMQTLISQPTPQLMWALALAQAHSSIFLTDCILRALIMALQAASMP